MASLPNPLDALPSLEQAIASGEVKLRRGDIDQSLGMTVDRPNGDVRVTYVRLEGTKVAALVMAIPCAPYGGMQCFNIGYAVAEGYRGQGRAKEIVAASISEMRHGFGNAGLDEFYIEAIVAESNTASIRVAELVISENHIPTVDDATGIQSRQYLMKISAHVKQ